MNLDDIKYGNPPTAQIKKIKSDKAGVLKGAIKMGIVDKIINEYPFPANSSDETQEELEYLLEVTNGATDEDRKFCKLIEEDHYTYFANLGTELGIEGLTKEIVDGWCDEVDPLTFYLKHKFNRPRPYQLANELKIPLYPIILTDANSAAYPSGHTMDFLVILYHFGKMKPDLVGKLLPIYENIKTIRETSGVHYPSDRKVSEEIFKLIVEAKLI
jgi:hypothetical protein